MDDYHLSVTDLTYQFRQKTILHQVSFEAQRHKITCLVGPSGSGKSTVCRLINRLMEPPKGTILLDGKDVVDRQPQALRREVGMV
ncbi:MAG: ATP-binding cassette domain-containing protein, partial [Chloroflexota bacterium]